VTADGGRRSVSARAPHLSRLAKGFCRFFVKHYQRPLERNIWFWSAVIFSAFTFGWASAQGDALLGLAQAGIAIYWVGVAEHVARNFRDGLRDRP
jgi:hypothetical protein